MPEHRSNAPDPLVKSKLATLWERYDNLNREPSLKAIAILKAIVQQHPSDLRVYRELAELYHRMNLTEECIMQYSVLVEYFFKHHIDRAGEPKTVDPTSPETEYALLIRAQIASGESRNREFKSTLRKNLKSGMNDEGITDSILKTIAAFLNSDSGTLYIGVSDDGSILGLENDGFASNDQLLLHLNDKVKSRLGVLAASSISATIVDLQDEKQVCVVECRKSEKLVFMASGKVNREVCYVRTGPATVELPPSQLLDYVAARAKRTEPASQQSPDIEAPPSSPIH